MKLLKIIISEIFKNYQNQVSVKLLEIILSEIVKNNYQ